MPQHHFNQFPQRTYHVKIALYDTHRCHVVASFIPYYCPNVQLASDYAAEIARGIRDPETHPLPPFINNAIEALKAVVPGATYRISAVLGEE